MKRFVLVFLLLGWILTSCAATGQGIKPTLTPYPLPGDNLPTRTPTASGTVMPAMTISAIILGENPHPAGGLPVTLRVKSSIDTPEARITIKLPEEVSMLIGKEAWTGDLKAEQELFLNLTLAIPKLSRADTIWIEAVGALPDGGSYTKTIALFVRPAPDGKIEISTTPFGN
jgi:hypothetical protein